jgi:2-polyprenyl-3-methyl-5-hydroxy-6-metoxy-1,4-benzoquinol methylase
MLKRQVLGLTYLLSHPPQLKRLIIRETRFGQRYQSKRGWLEWQEYDQYIANLVHTSAEGQVCPLHVARVQTISDMVSSLGSGLSVLDVGCGHGMISEHLWKMGNHVTCADLPMVTHLAHRRRVLLVVAADAEQLAFASNSFDVVLASELLEHLWNPHGFLDEAYRVLRANGHLIIEVPEGREGLRWDSHIQHFTLEGLKQMPGKRFTVREVKRLKPVKGIPTPTIILLLRKSMITKN